MHMMLLYHMSELSVGVVAGLVTLFTDIVCVISYVMLFHTDLICCYIYTLLMCVFKTLTFKALIM